MLGIIAGTVFLKEPLFDNLEQRTFETAFGSATVFLNDRVAYLPRHGIDRNRYVLPHMINHPANIAALKEVGVKGVVSVCSTGSLKREICPGSIVIPDDFICLSTTPTVFHDRDVHVPPLLDEGLRGMLTATAEPLLKGLLHRTGIYWQTTGPRFETRAEIHLMAKFAHIVGMTLASEAIICCELAVPCAAICSVDNYAHGMGDETLSAQTVQESARANAAVIAAILRTITNGSDLSRT